MADNPALRGKKKEEEERKGGGLFFWLSRKLSSRYVLVAAITGALTISALGIKDILQRSGGSGQGVSRAAASRPDRAGGPRDGAGAQAGQDGSAAPKSVSAAGAPDPSAQSSAQQGTGDQAAVQALMAMARKQAEVQSRAQAGGASRPAAKPEEKKAEQKPAAAKAPSVPAEGSGGPAARRPAVQGGAVQDPRTIKALTRSWQNRAPARTSRLQIGAMGALDRLKGMEAALSASRGRRVESEGSIQKREWDAAAHTDVAMTARGNSMYNARIKEEIAGKPNDGGPIPQAGPVGNDQGQGQSAVVNFPEEKPSGKKAQDLMDAAAFLLPLASFMLLGSYKPDESQSTSISKLAAMGGMGASAVSGMCGAGIMMDGQPVTGGMIMAVSALLANASAQNL